MGVSKREYTDAEKFQVWQMANIIDNVDSDIWRQDYAGAWIRFSDYGNRNSQYGWEIDHLKPVSRGGTDDMDNLYPLHWQNNRKKADSYPVFSTSISSEGVTNIEMLRSWRAE